MHFNVESIISDLPKLEASVTQNTEIATEVLAEAQFAGVSMGEQNDATA